MKRVYRNKMSLEGGVGNTVGSRHRGDPVET